MFWSNTAAKRSLLIDAPEGSLNAFPSAVMIFVVFAEAEDPLAAMRKGRRTELGPHLTSLRVNGPVRSSRMKEKQWKSVELIFV
jgi:hypothetical protein